MSALVAVWVITSVPDITGEQIGFAAFDIPNLTDEELGLPPEKIKYTMNHDTKVGLIVLFIVLGMLLLFGIIAAIAMSS